MKAAARFNTVGDRCSSTHGTHRRPRHDRLSSKMFFKGRCMSTRTVHPALIESALTDLRAFLSDRVTAGLAAREHHSHDESSRPPALPDLVCFPQSTDEVSQIIAVSARHKLPIVPFGAGTSLEGQVHAVRGGISIDMRRMNRIHRISVEDMDATVEAGVSRMQLTSALENTGLTFFIDPGADATLGGMASTRASGTTAVRYGTMRENVLGLTVVLPMAESSTPARAPASQAPDTISRTSSWAPREPWA